MNGRPLPPIEPGRVLVCGHKGAAALARENTVAAIEAALALGVDLVEVDVVRGPDGRLLLAHSQEELVDEAPTLAEAAALLARAGAWLDLDLKGRGFEAQAVAVVQQAGLARRTLVTSVFADSLRVVRRHAPDIATGLSYPWDRRGVSARPALAPLVRAGSAGLRAALPRRIVGMVEGAEADAAMLHHSVVSRAAVERLHASGLAVFAWTVDDRGMAEEMAAAGVDGVISNDPRLLAGLERRLSDGPAGGRR